MSAAVFVGDWIYEMKYVWAAFVRKSIYFRGICALK